MSLIPRSNFDGAHAEMVERLKKASSKSQLEKFKEAAREAETDEDEDAFEQSLRRIAEQKLKQEKETPDK